MLYELVQFSDQIGPLNVFRYITFRSVGATVTAMLIVFVFGPMMIDVLRVRQGKGQPIREDGPKSHLSKRGTPTMGGLMILSAVLVSTLLWSNWRNAYVWLVLGVMLSYGAIGFYDDFLKVTKRSADGFSGRMQAGARSSGGGRLRPTCSCSLRRPALPTRWPSRSSRAC